MPVSITDALDIIYKNVKVVSTETLPIENTLGYTLQEDKIASFDLPRFDNSAMDGYAVKCNGATQTVKVNNTIIYAGDNPTMTLQDNEAIKIMTGAVLPKGTQAVVPIENVTHKNDSVELPLNVALNANLRYAGEDVKKGECYLHKGSKITAYSIACRTHITHFTS